MAGKVAGTVYVDVDGNRLSIKGSITCAFSDFEREQVVGADGVHGFKESYLAPFVEVTATTTKELDLKLLTKATNRTVQVKMANGKSVILTGAQLANQPEINPEEGEVVLRFEGIAGDYVNTAE